jgi:uncharacterized membrane protein
MVGSMRTSPRRLWEIDALRGLAVVAMIFFHFMWDLWFLGLTSENIPGSGWQTFARSIGATFTFLLGVSLTLSAAQMQARGRDPWPPTLRRGLTVLACGLVISLGTYLFVGADYVRFGILHHAGAAMIIGYWFIRVPRGITLALAIVLIALGPYMPDVFVTHEWLIPFGIYPRSIGMVDYYPLVPWLGVALLGIVAGRTAYADGQRHFELPDLSASQPITWLCTLGRNSLVVYLAHQPLLIGALLGGRALGLW